VTKLRPPRPPFAAPWASGGPARGPIVLVGVMLPALAAIWLVPGFVTQDGPAHLYNARVILESLGPSSPFAAAYRVSWSPVPNWLGHVVLATLMAAGATPWIAGRAMMSITLVGPPAAAVWLRYRVRGGRGIEVIALLAALLGMSCVWILGFYGFLLGASLCCITLGVWWGGREKPGPALAATIAAWVVLGYFAHLVSAGVTALGLVVLAAATPTAASSRRRLLAWTLAGIAPLLPLGAVYVSIAGVGGAAELGVTGGLHHAAVFGSLWTRHLRIDPITLTLSRLAVPFGHTAPAALGFLAPSVLTALALVALLGATVLHARPLGRAGAAPPDEERRDPRPWREMRGWMVLALLLLVAGVLGPDYLGEHGSFMSQRLVLLGLLVSGIALDLPRRPVMARACGALLGLALVVQTALFWDFAVRSGKAARPYYRAATYVARGARMAAVSAPMPWASATDWYPFRANPLRHVEMVAGAAAGAVVWSNYEATSYLFQVRPRPGVPHPPVSEFERISFDYDSTRARERTRAWAELLARYQSDIDVLIVRGHDPGGLDSATAAWFEPVAVVGLLTVMRRR
jgi:hypothetical protein